MNFSEGEDLEEFDTMSKKEMQEIVGEPESTSCKDDPIPSEIVKRDIYILLPLIIKLVNESLKQAEFPKQWKRSTITPCRRRLEQIQASQTIDWLIHYPFWVKALKKQC